MPSQTMSAAIFETSSDTARSYRGWVIFAGITMLVLGTAAVIYTGTATIASVVLFGSLPMFAGALQIVHAFQVISAGRSWSSSSTITASATTEARLGGLLNYYSRAA
jgi:uncharacterized membrane protein HdeD (DUF308 family)